MTLVERWVLGGDAMSEVDSRNRSEPDDPRLNALKMQIKEINDRISEERPWRLGPLRVKKGAVDIIAFATFIITIANLLYNITDYFSAADIVPFPPYQIVIASGEALKRTVEKPSPVLFTAVTQYINRSSSGHSAIVQRELLRAVFDISGLQSKTVNYIPQQVVTTSTLIKDPRLTPLIDAPVVSDPSIVVVNPQSAVTHEILFWPAEAPDWYEWSTFTKDGENKEITIRIDLLPAIYTKQGIFSSYGQKTVQTSCVVKLSQPDFTKLRNQGWLAPVCRKEG
jgi:hypothetical protein